jgi:hypothetical protein
VEIVPYTNLEAIGLAFIWLAALLPLCFWIELVLVDEQQSIGGYKK